MNFFERLKKLKLIEPDALFSERSKRDIMASPVPVFVAKPLSLSRILYRLLEAGVAGALVTLFLLLVTGKFTNSPLSPVPFSAVNPESLHAEAQAIDIQIKLAELSYRESTSTSGSTTTEPALKPKPAAVTAPVTTPDGATSTASSTLSVDSVLDELSQ